MPPHTTYRTRGPRGAPRRGSLAAGGRRGGGRRPRGHSPGIERAAKALGKAGNNGAVWVALGVALAIVDDSNREAWLICAALGPIAVGLNYVIKAIARG